MPHRLAVQPLWDRNPLPGRGEPRQPTSTNYLQPQTPATAKPFGLSRFKKKASSGALTKLPQRRRPGEAEVGAGVRGPGGDISPARPRAEAGPLLTSCASSETGSAAEERSRGPSPGGKARPPADGGPAPAGCRTEQARRAGLRRGARSVPPPVPLCPAGPRRGNSARPREEGGVIRGARCCPGRAALPGQGGRLPLLPQQVGGPGGGQSLLPSAGRGAQPAARADGEPLPPLPHPAGRGRALTSANIITPLRCGASAALAPQHGEASRPRGKLSPPHPAGRRGAARQAPPAPLPPPSAAARRPQPRSRPRNWLRRGRHLGKATCTAAAAAPRPARPPIGAAGRGAASDGAGRLPPLPAPPPPTWAGGTISSPGGPLPGSGPRAAV